jgi:hypothetical protein
VEVVEEEYSEVEEEEEEAVEPELVKAVTDSLKDEKEELSQEELERRIYAAVVEQRTEEDMDEIRRIVQIISGQWRSGHFRRHAGEDAVQQSLTGTAEQQKKFEEKRKARNQKRARQAEERATRMSAGSVRQIVERAMWMQAANSPDASPMDRLRASQAKLGNRDPRKEMLERVEMNAFLRAERARDARELANLAHANRLTTVSRRDVAGAVPAPKMSIKAGDIARRQSSFSFVVSDRPESAPKKQAVGPAAPKKAGANPQLAQFLTRTASAPF